MALKVPTPTPTKTIIYSDLKGVDFSQDASMVDRKRSPEMLNMISDEGGNPVKRKGWEILADISEDEMLGIWSFKCTDEHIVFAAKQENTIYFYEYKNLQCVEIGTVTADAVFAFYYKGKDKDGLWAYCGDSVHLISESDGDLILSQPTLYVPKIVLSRLPSGSNGGRFYEDFNRLTLEQTESFITKLASSDESAAVNYKLTTKAKTDGMLKFEYLSGGNWVTDAGATFTNATTVHSSVTVGAPSVDGVDNVRITYIADRDIDTAMLSCRQYAYYSLGATDQVFVTASPEAPQKVYYSAVGDPTYFPELNYLDLSGDNGQCMGFLHVGQELAVIKSSEHDNFSNIFLIYSTTISSVEVQTDNTTKTTAEYEYAVKRIASSAGAIAINGFGSLGDEPLFLSKTGLYGIVSTNVAADRVVRNRSRFVDSKMLNEADLEKSFVLTKNDYLYVFVNDKAYVFDGRHKTSDVNNNTNYMYEAYYWENIPIKYACISNEAMYFVNDDHLCRFKNTGRMDDYSDGSHWDNDEQVGGTAIHAIWATRNDDDGMPQMFKTMLKKGSMSTFAPYEKSSVMVWAKPDGELGGYFIGEFVFDMNTGFENVDFSHFTFDTRQGPKDYFFKKKRKKYIRLQLLFENDKVNEGFGIHTVVKTITSDRYAKQRR